MLIEHIGLLSWVHGRPSAQKQKDHAQDCETLIENADQHLAILPWS
jgi:hypothetical protein